MSVKAQKRVTVVLLLIVILSSTHLIGSLGASQFFTTLNSSGNILLSTSRLDGLHRGVNFSPRDIWSSKITALDFFRIKSWGMDHVRFYIHWHMVERYRDQPGVYNEALLLQMDKWIKWAADAELLVILGVSKANDEGDGWMVWSEFFNDPDLRSRFYDLWTMLVTRFSSYNNVIGLTPCHVPGHQGGDILTLDGYQNVWHNTMIPEIVDRIRSVDLGVIIVYEPVLPYPQHFATLTPISDVNVYYSFNFYQPYTVTHSFGEYSGDKASLENSYWWQSVINFGNQYGVPLYCGEFGIEIRGSNGLQEPPTESRQLWVQHTIELFEENGIHWTYWIYGYDSWGFDLLNGDGSERALVDLLKQFSLS